MTMSPAADQARFALIGLSFSPYFPFICPLVSAFDSPENRHAVRGGATRLNPRKPCRHWRGGWSPKSP